MTAHIDHLVVFADSLAQGARWVHATLGAAAVPGGQHLTMGTHNLLLRIGPALYLEIIAIDPAQPPPPRPRWFDLDNPHLRRAVQDSPRLIHFVARCADIDACTRAAAHAPGDILDLTRGSYRWRITVPADGSLTESGLVPTLIEWRGATPAEQLPLSAVTLLRLSAWHPYPRRVEALYRAIGLHDVAVQRGAAPELAAVFATPLGEVAVRGAALTPPAP